MTITCPACEASISPPGGRRDVIPRCPWCGADLRPAPVPPPAPEPPPAPAPKPPPVPKPAVVAAERPARVRPEARPEARPKPVPRNDEPAPEASSERALEVVVASVILFTSAGTAACVFFAVRYLATVAG